MTGTEEEHFTSTSLPHTARTHYFTALEPRDEHQFVGIGNIEGLTVHFFVVDYKTIANAFCNWVTKVGYPQSFSFADFSPRKVTGSSEKTFEGFCVVPRVHCDIAHTTVYAESNLFCNAIQNLIVIDMTPPQ